MRATEMGGRLGLMSVRIGVRERPALVEIGP